MLKIHGDRIILDKEVYVGTLSLGMLITDKRPKICTTENCEKYKELLHETNVIYHDYDPESSYLRANRSMKWNKVLQPTESSRKE